MINLLNQVLPRPAPGFIRDRKFLIFSSLHGLHGKTGLFGVKGFQLLLDTGTFLLQFIFPLKNGSKIFNIFNNRPDTLTSFIPLHSVLPSVLITDPNQSALGHRVFSVSNS